MGKLITFEGIDGSGKGTQVKKVIKYLNKRKLKCELFSFPIYTSKTGEIISEYLTGAYGTNLDVKQVCLFYAANRVAIRDSIKRALVENDFVIMDRYTYSNLFSISKLPKEKWDEYIHWLEELEFGELDLPKPDYNFYLRMDPKLSIERTTKRGLRDYQKGKADIHEKDISLLQSTTECYMYLSIKRPDWIIVNQMINGRQLHEEKVFSILKMYLDDIIAESTLGEEILKTQTVSEMIQEIDETMKEDDSYNIET